MSSASKRTKSKDEANSIAQEIAIDLIELEVKQSNSKVFATISRVDENGMAVPISARLTTTASTDHVGESNAKPTRSMIERGIQFKTYFVWGVAFLFFAYSFELVSVFNFASENQFFKKGNL